MNVVTNGYCQCLTLPVLHSMWAGKGIQCSGHAVFQTCSVCGTEFSQQFRMLGVVSQLIRTHSVLVCCGGYCDVSAVGHSSDIHQDTQNGTVLLSCVYIPGEVVVMYGAFLQHQLVLDFGCMLCPSKAVPSSPAVTTTPRHFSHTCWPAQACTYLSTSKTMLL